MSVLPRRKSQTSISPGTEIEGDLRSAGDVQLDGVIRGNVTARQLSIGPGGSLLGDVAADTVHIEGQVQGHVSAAFVALARDAKVTGEIVYGELSADLGALLQGRCRPRAANAKEIDRPAPTTPRQVMKGGRRAAS